MKVCAFLTSPFAAGGRGRQNSLPPERPRMRRLTEVPTFSSGPAHSHALAASVGCGISVRVDANRTKRIRSLSFIPTEPGRIQTPAEAALSGKFGGRPPPSLCSLITPVYFTATARWCSRCSEANRQFKTATLHTNHTALKFPPLQLIREQTASSRSIMWLKNVMSRLCNTSAGY